MRVIIFCLILFCFACNSKGELELNERLVEMSYVAFGCECAKWVPVNTSKREDYNEVLEQLACFIEPANGKENDLSDSLSYGDRILFTGRFYENKGYPEGFINNQGVKKSRVFRYTKYSILKNKNLETKL